MKEDLKARRIRVFGELPVYQMSATTRQLFKKWGHRRDEILKFESPRRSLNRIKQTEAKKVREKEARELSALDK